LCLFKAQLIAHHLNFLIKSDSLLEGVSFISLYDKATVKYSILILYFSITCCVWRLWQNCSYMGYRHSL